MGFLANRLGAYAAQRLQEPSTWAGLVASATAIIGYNAPPDIQAAIVQVGVAITGLLLAFIREGRNVPENPSIKATIVGKLPDPKPNIVPERVPDTSPEAARVEATVERVVQAECGPDIRAPLDDATHVGQVRPGFGKGYD